MPSPIGHALAGIATAGLFRSRQDSPASSPWTGRLAIICAALAIAPDLDLLYLPIHRMATHSVTAIGVVLIIAAGVTGWVTGRIQWGIALACAVAYGSHILLDWLGADASNPRGIQMFWPFSHEWFIAPWPIFPGTERRSPFSSRSLLINAWAALFELTVMGAVAWAAVRAGKAGGAGRAGG